ncbi:hypothetical protein [Actinospica robiniae]|uniref:hypothetical protein n=1 Tax=Actinospica robiniae TaxID=304901 RepID=UPI00041C8624|nr:hypothetical protein [Actinospica robiniae]
MTDRDAGSQYTQTPPQPPRSGPVPPTRTQLRAAAAWVTTLAHQHRARLAESSLPLVQPDLHWLLRAHIAPAFTLAGLHLGPASQRCVLRLVLAALQDAAAVRPAELGFYLESVTTAQQLELLAVAHRSLADA